MTTEIEMLEKTQPNIPNTENPSENHVEKLGTVIALKFKPVFAKPEPYFPPTKIGNNKRHPYSEIVKCFNSLGYVIQVDEKEYLALPTPLLIPAMCPGKHGIVNVRLTALRNGGSCCMQCGRVNASKTLLDKTGFDNALKNPETREKCKQTLLLRTGFDHNMKNPESLEKRKKTWIENTGFDSPMKNPETKEKARQTTFDKTGFYHQFENPDFQAKIRAERLERTGYSTPFSDPAVQAKIRTTLLARTGYDNNLKNPEMRAKGRLTYFRKTGYYVPMHNPEVVSKVHAAQFRHKPYTYPSGRETTVQGYEGFCIDDLLNNEEIEETDICNEISFENDPQKMPEIWYEFDGKTRRYYPDIFIPSQNRIIEVKSQYIFDLHREMNLAKAEACLEAGYNYEFRFYDKDGELIEIVSMN